jgi:DNA (cytosine-5)-methyltransferase 1
MKAVELFAGIGGFRVAADAHRIQTVWANDKDPKACAVYRARFGSDVLREGDVQGLKDSLPGHDLLTAGFPCQPFSSAGKKEGVRDPRGTLFQVVIELLERHRPQFFILENVKRLLTMEKGFHFATILASLSELDYAIEWRLLNAMHFGLPQNRQRVFLIGTRSAAFRPPDKNWRIVSARLAPTEDLSLLSVYEAEDVADTRSWRPITKHGGRFPSWGLAAAGTFHGADLPFSRSSPVVPIKTVLEENVSRDFDFTETTLKWLPNNTPVNRLVQGVEILSNQGGGARMGYTIFGVNGVAPTLTSTASRHYERYKVDGRYRRLTNVEYARIQGFADDHCAAVSTYDQYALIGNAVPPPMVAWVMDRLTACVEYEPCLRSARQRTFF